MKREYKDYDYDQPRKNEMEVPKSGRELRRERRKLERKYSK